MGKTRKCKARENRGGEEKFPPVFFFLCVRRFSIPRSRLFRSLEQATLKVMEGGAYSRNGAFLDVTETSVCSLLC